LKKEEEALASRRIINSTQNGFGSSKIEEYKREWYNNGKVGAKRFNL